MRLRHLIAAAAVAVLAIPGLGPGTGTATFAHEHIQRDAAMDAAPTGASLYNLESKWTTQDGASVALASFGGKPVVAAMGYTTCKDICPAIVADMVWVEKRLPAAAENRVKFAFFSFNSEADTPERLRLYVDGRGLDLSRWTLLRADNDAVRQLAAALSVGYRPDGQGGFEHAAVISLLDDKGEIVFQQRGSQASSDELLARLTALLAQAK